MLSPVQRELFLDTGRSKTAVCLIKIGGYSVLGVGGVGFQSPSCGI